MTRYLPLFGFILLVVVSGCSNEARSQEDYKVIYSSEELQEDSKREEQADITVAIIPKLVNIPYFNAVRDGAMEAGKKIGVNVIYTGPKVADSSQQIAVINDLIASGEPDVIAVSANDPKKLLPVLKKAQNAGIKVITWDADTEPEGREFFVNMVNPETLGRHLMDTLAWNMDEKGEFAVLTGAASASNLNEWLKWIKIQQEEYYPEMKLVEVAPTDDDPHKAYLAAQRIIEENPDLAGFIGNSSVGPPAAAEAVKEAEKAGEIAVVGLSSPNPMNEYLKDGSAQMITLWSPKKLGYLAVALSKDLEMGQYPDDNQEIPGVGRIRMIDDMVIMGEPIDFTKENVDQYDF